jgi:hypothetical protein
MDATLRRMGALGPSGLAGGDEPNRLVRAAMAMDDDEQPQGGAQAKQNEPRLLTRMVRVREQQRVLITESGDGFVE